MRHLLLALLLALLAACSSGSGSDGGGLGIKFANIPVGTQFFYEDKRQGLTWMKRYDGQKDGKHVMRKFFRDARRGGYTKLVSEDYFDQSGRLTRTVDHSFDFTYVFAPFNCLNSAPGKCTHRMAVFDTETGARRNLQIKHFELRRQGNVLHVVANAKSNRLKERHTLDENNMVVAFSEPRTTFSQDYRLVRTVSP